MVLGVMIIGVGDISKCYFSHCRRDERTRLIAAADPAPKARKWAMDNYNVNLAVADYREALGRDDIDVVIVCTPHNLHHPIVMDALRAGKDVICEKPISVSVAQADEMIDFAAKCGRKLLVTLNSQFPPRTFRIKEILSEGKLGKVFMSHAAYLGYEFDRMADPDHWKGDMVKAGGGVLLDGGYHIVDLMNSFMGRARYVQALGGKFVVQAPNKGEDNISLLIEYEHGAIADLQVSFTVCNAGCRREPTLMIDMDLYGTDGSVRYQYGWDTVKIHESLKLLRPDEPQQNIDLIHNDCPDCYTHFFDCLTDSAAPIVTAIQARNASAVVEAAYESARGGGKVEVDWRT